MDIAGHQVSKTKTTSHIVHFSYSEYFCSSKIKYNILDPLRIECILHSCSDKKTFLWKTMSVHISVLHHSVTLGKKPTYPWSTQTKETEVLNTAAEHFSENNQILSKTRSVALHHLWSAQVVCRCNKYEGNKCFFSNTLITPGSKSLCILWNTSAETQNAEANTEADSS